MAGIFYILPLSGNGVVVLILSLFKRSIVNPYPQMISPVSVSVSSAKPTTHSLIHSPSFIERASPPQQHNEHPTTTTHNTITLDKTPNHEDAEIQLPRPKNRSINQQSLTAPSQSVRRNLNDNLGCINLGRSIKACT